MFRAEFCIILNRAKDAAPHLRIEHFDRQEVWAYRLYLCERAGWSGWVRVLQGEAEAGVRQAEAALEALKAIPSRRFHLPIRIVIVGRANKRPLATLRGALALYESAIEAAANTGERWYEPELLRLRAETLLALPR